MSFSDAISNLSESQMREIIRLRRSVPLAAFLAANSKARQACALRHRGWMDTVTIYVNSMIIAIKKNGIRDALDMATLQSSTESFAIGVLAREDLTLEEHNLLISCIAQIATPEIILSEQTWEPAPLPTNEATARKNYETLKQRDEVGRRKPREHDPDPDGDLIDTGIDPGKALAALLGGKKKKETAPVPAKVSKDEAIQKMLAAVGKKAISEVPVFYISREGSSYFLISQQGDAVKTLGPWDRPADAIVYATKNKLKLGSK